MDVKWRRNVRLRRVSPLSTMQRVWSTYLETVHGRGAPREVSTAAPGPSPWEFRLLTYFRFSPPNDDADGQRRLPVCFCLPLPAMHRIHAPSLSTSSRRHSFAGSAYSQAGSTRPILSDMNSSAELAYSTPKSLAASPFSSLNPTPRPTDSAAVSLSVNYIPHKFSDALLGGSLRHRRNNVESTFGLPKLGGGVDAFRSGESRIPGLNDEDDNGGISGRNPRTGRRARWTRFKWILFVANLCVCLFLVSPFPPLSRFIHSSLSTLSSPSSFAFSPGSTCGTMPISSV
jgi:hypothetical protein